MRLRFSIRDLLWLTLVVALAVAWRLDSDVKTKQIRLLERADKLQHSQIGELSSDVKDAFEANEKMAKRLREFEAKSRQAK